MAITILFASCVASLASAASAQEPTPTPSEPRFTASDVINVVNSLRIANGLAPLAVHPVLMQVAQAEASGIAGGYGGHWRPANLTLGQWLLSLGYPLSGDLSMDGYRAENWFMASTSSDLEEVTQFWQADAEHRDTMFSPDRSDIGAAVAVGAGRSGVRCARDRPADRQRQDASGCVPDLDGYPANPDGIFRDGHDGRRERDSAPVFRAGGR